MAIARQVAVPCTLAELQQGNFVQNPGLEPSGVKTHRGMVSRASILGVIIEKADATMTVEDGTTALSVRSFDKPILANVGDLVLVIGKPREYNGERYIALEICKRLRNKSWVDYRRKELEHLRIDVVPTVHVEKREHVEPPKHEAQVVAESKNPFEAIIERIRSLDKGQGANIEEVIDTIPDGSKFVRTLIEEGEIFEIRPGRLKVLE